MKVQVKLFGVFRDYGREGTSFYMDVKEGASIGEVLGLLAIPEDAPKTLVCNHRAGQMDQVLQEGDVLAIFPPVEGGG